ncbi:hypothetical protein KC19_2G031900 [Ceratodon purpureus]|uniref:Uncharacterized protein n=1 Tax=Ceratodon purpureus TaxID=3225 RepID=A0A8T0ISE5_CERPU|nr:hypothetical protein KC19_2G031900 [Ceratodon purpureus]
MLMKRRVLKLEHRASPPRKDVAVIEVASHASNSVPSSVNNSTSESTNWQLRSGYGFSMTTYSPPARSAPPAKCSSEADPAVRRELKVGRESGTCGVIREGSASIGAWPWPGLGCNQCRGGAAAARLVMQ